MTIMTQGDSDSVRRCDATCHKAKKPGCTCICGGRYHGRGSSEAAQEQLTKDWLGETWRETKAAVEAAGGKFEVVVAEAIQKSVRVCPHGTNAHAFDDRCPLWQLYS